MSGCTKTSQWMSLADALLIGIAAWASLLAHFLSGEEGKEVFVLYHIQKYHVEKRSTFSDLP